jgi:hypothetical protein
MKRRGLCKKDERTRGRYAAIESFFLARNGNTIPTWIHTVLRISKQKQAQIKKKDLSPQQEPSLF